MGSGEAAFDGHWWTAFDGRFIKKVGYTWAGQRWWSQRWNQGGSKLGFAQGIKNPFISHDCSLVVTVGIFLIL